MSLVTDLCGVSVGGGGVGGDRLGPEHHGDPGVGEVPGHGDAAVQGAVTGLAVFREEAHVTEGWWRLRGAGYNVNIHSAPVWGCAHCEDRRSTARLLSPALSLSLSLAPSVARPGCHWPSCSCQSRPAQPAPAQHSGYTGGQDGEHVIF